MIVFTNGCFDIIHVGHVGLLKECRELAGIDGKVIVAINSDASVKRLKGEVRPMNPEKDRADVLMALRYVDEVLIFDEDTPINVVQRVKPDIIVKGGDWKLEDVVGREFTTQVIIYPYQHGNSTTRLIQALIKERTGDR